MFLGIEYEVDVVCQIVVGIVGLAVETVLDDSLVDGLHAQRERPLQCVDKLIGGTLARNPQREGKGQPRQRLPLLGQIVRIGEQPLVVEDLVADKQEGVVDARPSAPGAAVVSCKAVLP